MQFAGVKSRQRKNEIEGERVRELEREREGKRAGRFVLQTT